MKISDFGKDFVEWLQIVQNEIIDENNHSRNVCADISVYWRYKLNRFKL